MQQLLLLRDRKPRQIPTREIEQIEGIEVGVTGRAAAKSILELLKRRSAIVVQRHDLAVEDELPWVELAQRVGQRGKARGQIIPVPRDERERLRIANRQRPVAVELQLVERVAAARESPDELGLHRLDPGGSSERLSFWSNLH